MGSTHQNALRALTQLLYLSNVRVTRVTLREKLWRHPDFPSLISLSDTLDEFNIDNLAVRLTPSQLFEIPLPAVVYLNSEGGIFAPVRMVASDTVEWWHDRWGWQTETFAQFNQHWNGVALVIEPTEQSGEHDYAKSWRKQLLRSLRLPFTVLSLLFCTVVWAKLFNKPLVNAASYYHLMLLHIAGVIVSGITIFNNIYLDNDFFCTPWQPKNNTNRNYSLHSFATGPFNGLSWAEVELFYFGSGLLMLTLFYLNPTKIYEILLAVNVLSLLFISCFVLYLWCRTKQQGVSWLIVQVLLWVEFAVLLHCQTRFTLPVNISGPEIELLLSAFILPPALWILLKPIGQKALSANVLQQNLQKIKFDPYYLDSLRQRARILPPIFTEMQLPMLGNPNAANILIVVISPTCLKCAKVHSEIEHLMSELTDVKCYFIMTVAHRSSNKDSIIIKHILSLSMEQMPLALHKWYAVPNIKTWLKNTLVTQLTEKRADQFDLHLRWCELAGVKATPAVFFNGVEIPCYYTMEESKRLLHSLKKEI